MRTNSLRIPWVYRIHFTMRNEISQNIILTNKSIILFTPLSWVRVKFYDPLLS